MNLSQKKKNDVRNALRTLQEVLHAEYSGFVRDAAIQRFEYTTEALWKCLQVYLKEQEGIECYSPKSCMREAKKNGLLEEHEIITALEMIDDRNLTSHTYHEEVADVIYKKLFQYAQLIENILERMK